MREMPDEQFMEKGRPGDGNGQAWNRPVCVIVNMRTIEGY